MSLAETRINSTVGRERFADRTELLEGATYVLEGMPRPLADGFKVTVTAVDSDMVEVECEGVYGRQPLALTWRFASEASRKFFPDGLVGKTADGRRWGHASGQSTEIAYDVDPELDQDKPEIPHVLAQHVPHDEAMALMAAVWGKASAFVADHPERMLAGSLFQAANMLRRDRLSRVTAATALSIQDERIATHASVLDAGFAALEEMTRPAPAP